jgi:GNAT superfamily N-acetyltransferase
LYVTERDFVDDFLNGLDQPSSPWELSGYTEQFDYVSGRTDVVATDDAGHLVAFEAKLVTWREALFQAYRSRSFAHRAYVVLPPTPACEALRFEPEFRRRGVGICTLTNHGVAELLESLYAEPLLTWLSERARKATHTPAEEAINHFDFCQAGGRS